MPATRRRMVMVMDFFFPRDSTSAPVSMSDIGEAVMRREERMDSHSAGVQEEELERRELMVSCFTVGLLVYELMPCCFCFTEVCFFSKSYFKQTYQNRWLHSIAMNSRSLCTYMSVS